MRPPETAWAYPTYMLSWHIRLILEDFLPSSWVFKASTDRSHGKMRPFSEFPSSAPSRAGFGDTPRCECTSMMLDKDFRIPVHFHSNDRLTLGLPKHCHSTFR